MQPIPRDRDPKVAVVGEKLEYKGVHFKRGQPSYQGGDEKLIYKADGEQYDEDGYLPKNRHRKVLKERDHNDGAHFDYGETVHAVIDIARENKIKNRWRDKNSSSPVSSDDADAEIDPEKFIKTYGTAADLDTNGDTDTMEPNPTSKLSKSDDGTLKVKIKQHFLRQER